MIGLPRSLAVVCHDAGAANLILPWLVADNPADLRAVMRGPAAVLWTKRFPEERPMPLEAALDGASALLSGTGWGSDVEHRARRLARQRGIRSIAVIDHWVNYRERFVRGGEGILPDAIWVTDEAARDLAAREFPGLSVELKPNLYLEEQLAHVPPTPGDGDVLFVAEPMRSNWGRPLAGEFQAIEYFLSRREEAGIPSDVPIRIRPHPSDADGKYDAYLRQGIVIDGSPDIGSAIAGARWVVGCQSYALVVALSAGREVLSALPPHAPPCVLPQPGIVHLARL